ncbi:sodium channel protein Nach [Anastrepha obliqua]|uniref:sodium channel protein Nach n=1 Tax=Anastrepha obliqua TaxID=95512 RepID=UPI00240922D5|nr:sodium channel protein Nach [Anastrepha obliqua]
MLVKYRKNEDNKKCRSVRKFDKMFIQVWKQNAKGNKLKQRPKLKQPQHFHPQILNPNYRQDVMQRLRLAIVDTFWEYTQTTKVSGIWLLRRNKTHGISRWIWSTVLLSLLLLGVYLSLQLWLKFYSYPILNTISSDLAITDVAFPGITICSPKVVNRERVQRYIKTLNIPDNIDLQKVAVGFEYINAFTDQNWKTPGKNSFKYADEVLRLNNKTIYEAAKAVSGNCNDFVKRCYWGITEFPCRQRHEYLSFISTTSFLGPCCSFNYNPKNLSYVPFSANIFGIDGGLTIVGAEGSERNLSTGLIVLVHHPMDYVTEVTSSVTITSNSESFVEISPTVQSSSPEVLELSQGKRDCLISDDLELHNYRQAACLLACRTEALMKLCNCVPYHMPNSLVDFRECKLNDSACYSQNYDSFKSVKCESCLPNCYDVTYSSSAYKADLKLHNCSVSTHYSTIDAYDTFIVRAYLTKQTVPAIRKVVVMSWIGLLSDLGGVFNLCLGISMVSLIEFSYYCTHRLYVNYKTHCVLLQSLNHSQSKK